MSLTSGPLDVVAVKAGTLDIAKVMVGGEQVWPNEPTDLILIGGELKAANTGVFPSHRKNDLLVAVAQSYNTAAGSVPPVPAAGWTIAYQSTDVPLPIVVAWKIADASGTNTNTGYWASSAVMATYVFRNANNEAPFGFIGSRAGYGSSFAASVNAAPKDTSGKAILLYQFTNDAGFGTFNAAAPAGLTRQATLPKSVVDRKDDSSTGGTFTETHANATVNWRNLAMEVVPKGVTFADVPQWLYGVRVEYLDNYVVRFTALKGYEDPDNEFFMFRCVQMPKDGYTARVFEKQWQINGYGAMDCTLEDLWGDGNPTASSVIPKKTISFKILPSATGGRVDEIIVDQGRAVRSAPTALIKGNRDSMLYHLPSSPNYRQTVAEEWFETEEQAIAAGYKKAGLRKKRTMRKKS